MGVAVLTDGNRMLTLPHSLCISDVLVLQDMCCSLGGFQVTSAVCFWHGCWQLLFTCQSPVWAHLTADQSIITPDYLTLLLHSVLCFQSACVLT